MRLVLDTNILIAALIKKSVTREILVHPDMDCIVPEFAFEEIAAVRDEILRKSRLSEDQFALLLEELKSNLAVFPGSEIAHREEARRVMDPIDPEDTVFLALALSTPNEGIWSQDGHFRKQSRVKVWRTEDLVRYLGITHA